MTSMTAETQPLAQFPLRTFTKQNIGVKDDGTIDLWGHCANFCAQAHDGAPTSGRSVEDHGLWCTTNVGLSVDGRFNDGERTVIAVQLSQPYTHGTYLAGVARASYKARGVTLVINADSDDDEERVEVHMKASDVRSLAAALLHAADNLERLARPIHDYVLEAEDD